MKNMYNVFNDVLNRTTVILIMFYILELYFDS